MGAFNSRDTYGWLTITLHWLAGLLIIGLLAGGLYSASLERGDKIPQLIGIHKQIGVAVLCLMFLRLVWRLVNRSIEPLTDGFTAFLGGLVHWLMYLAVMSQALIGIMMSQLSSRRPLEFLGWELPMIADAGSGKGMFTLPAYFTEEGARGAATMLREFHWIGGYVIIGLITLHFLGAILHALQGTPLIRRMWFGYQPEYAAKRFSETHGGMRGR